VRTWLLLVLAGGVWGRTAAAQAGVVPLDSTARAALAAAAIRIDSASVLRIKTLWGSTVLVDPRLDPAGIAYRVLRGDPARMDDRSFEIQLRSRATGPGAVAGAVLGGLAGALYGRVAAGIAGVDGQTIGSGATTGSVIQGGVLGAGFGAMFGAMIGTMMPGWRTIYRHPDR
jgi:hypothetical protein